MDLGEREVGVSVRYDGSGGFCAGLCCVHHFMGDRHGESPEDDSFCSGKPADGKTLGTQRVKEME